jgi:hypothetical protein
MKFKPLITEAGVKTLMTWIGALLAIAILGSADPVAAQLKLGYIDSQKILKIQRGAGCAETASGAQQALAGRS